jgi:hypothetical protein
MQSKIALSTTESECIALPMATRGLPSLRCILQENIITAIQLNSTHMAWIQQKLSHFASTLVYEDNEAYHCGTVMPTK